MKYIWLIEDYSRSNDGEAEYYGFCESEEKAQRKADELNHADYKAHELRYRDWLANGAVVGKGGRPSNPAENHTDFFEVVRVPLVGSDCDD